MTFQELFSRPTEFGPYVVSIDRFPFENNKKNLAPQSKMLGESESHQKCKISDVILKIENVRDFLIEFWFKKYQSISTIPMVIDTYCNHHLYASIHNFYI